MAWLEPDASLRVSSRIRSGCRVADALRDECISPSAYWEAIERGREHGGGVMRQMRIAAAIAFGVHVDDPALESVLAWRMVGELEARGGASFDVLSASLDSRVE